MKRAAIPFLITVGLCIGAGKLAAAPAIQPPLAAPAEAGLELLGQLGGYPTDVAVAGDVAYMAVGARVWAMDIADPAAPRLIGMSSTLPGRVFTVRATAGGVMALFSDEGAGGRITMAHFGPPDGRALRQVGQIELVIKEVQTLVVEGTRAIIIGREVVPSHEFTAWLVDLTDPRSMTASALPWPAGAEVIAPWSAVLVAGRYLYVLGSSQKDGSRLLEILDLTVPDQPALVGTAPLRGAAPVVMGSSLYLLDDSDQREPQLQSLDVTEPTRPQLRWSVAVTHVHLRAGRSIGLTVAGGYAFVLDRTGEIAAYDLSNPAAARLVGSPTGDQPVSTGVAVGNRLYLAAVGAADELPGLRVVDISQPTQLQDMGHVAVLPQDVHGIAVADGHAYVTAVSAVSFQAAGGLWDLDLSDPANPWPVALIERPVGCSRLVRQGRFLYASGSVCDRGGISASGTEATDPRLDPAVEPGLDIVDISEPGHPRLRGSLPEGALSYSLAVGAGRAYVAPVKEDAPSELLTIDVTDPDQPRVVGRGDLPGKRIYAAATDDLGARLFSSLDYGSFATFDVRRPEAPHRVRLDDFVSTYGSDLAVDGHRAILVGGNTDVYDISSVSGTHFLGSIATGDADLIALAGEIAWFGLRSRQLQGWDLSDFDRERTAHPASGTPEPPKGSLVATYTLPAYADSGRSREITALTADQDLVLTGAGESGLFILRFVDPEHPWPTPSPTPTTLPPGPRPLFLPLVLRAGQAAGRSGSLTERGTVPGRFAGLAYSGTGEVVLALQSGTGAAGAFEQRIVALDFHQPDLPAVVGTSEPLGVGLARGLAVREGVAYAPSQEGLALVDVHDLTRPQLIRYVETDGIWHGLTIVGSRAYLIGHSEMRILDLTDAAAPRVLGALTLAGALAGSSIKSVAAQDDLVVLALRPHSAASPGLVLVDVRDPTQTRIVDQSFPGQDVAAVTVDGRLAHAAPDRLADDGAHMAEGLVVLDITASDRFRELGFLLDPGFGEILSLATAGPDVMLLGGELGLRMWDLSNSSAPRELAGPAGTAGDTESGYWLAVHGDTAYAGTGAGVTAFGWSLDP
jgi:hypothetical protein